jgi:hypothetical protein
MRIEDRVRAATRARAGLVRDIRPLDLPDDAPAPARPLDLPDDAPAAARPSVPAGKARGWLIPFTGFLAARQPPPRAQRPGPPSQRRRARDRHDGAER